MDRCDFCFASAVELYPADDLRFPHECFWLKNVYACIVCFNERERSKEE